jgi:tetratricopeptide (TPR) repeat protein
MLSAKTLPLLLLCAGLAACASAASPEDVKMSAALGEQGKALLAAGKNDEAKDIYLSAISRDGKNARAWNGLGVSYDLLGKRDKARDAYRQALDLAPKDGAVANNLAHLYIEEGDAASAVDLLGPFANGQNVPSALKQNLAKASQMMQAKESLGGEAYADLGSFPTEGMAQGHEAKAKALLDDDDLSFLIVPEVKTEGGTPVFAIKVTGKEPKSICAKLSKKTFSCVPHEKP